VSTLEPDPEHVTATIDTAGKTPRLHAAWPPFLALTTCCRNHSRISARRNRIGAHVPCLGYSRYGMRRRTRQRSRVLTDTFNSLAASSVVRISSSSVTAGPPRSWRADVQAWDHGA